MYTVRGRLLVIPSHPISSHSIPSHPIAFHPSHPLNTFEPIKGQALEPTELFKSQGVAEHKPIHRYYEFIPRLALAIANGHLISCSYLSIFVRVPYSLPSCMCD